MPEIQVKYGPKTEVVVRLQGGLPIGDLDKFAVKGKVVGYHFDGNKLINYSVQLDKPGGPVEIIDREKVYTDWPEFYGQVIQEINRDLEAANNRLAILQETYNKVVKAQEAI